jgi:C-terminal processing protease CtpA/Prc
VLSFLFRPLDPVASPHPVPKSEQDPGHATKRASLQWVDEPVFGRVVEYVKEFDDAADAIAPTRPPSGDGTSRRLYAPPPSLSHTQLMPTANPNLHRLTRVRSARMLAGAAIAALTVLAGCGGGGSGGGAGDGDGGGSSGCGEAARKRFVLAAARDWYLFDDLLPASVDVDAFADAEELLDHLTATAREQRKDRFFSYLTTRAEENALLGDGRFIGFGVRTRTDPGNRPFLTEVFEGSPAAEAALSRGDEIVAVDSGNGFVPVSELLDGGTTISDALGPAETGIRRGLRLVRGGVTREVTMAKRTVTIDPVSDVYGALVLPLPGTAGVGYLNLRSYISSADGQLGRVFDEFRSRGLDYFIVDLRYNGGGLVDTAVLLNDLLGGARDGSQVQLRLVHNSRHSGANATIRFDPLAQSVRPVRIAFLTTGATASASEINVNSMAPWVEVAIVGEDTLGKPVGQLAFDLSGCQDRLRLVAFKNENARGEADFYDGLAATLDFACAAPDTLEQPLGAPTEGMTAAALEWLRTGACGTVMSDSAARAKPRAEPGTDRYPLPRHPTPAQWWLPGIG